MRRPIGLLTVLLTVCGLMAFAGGTVANAKQAEKTLMGQISKLDDGARTLAVKEHKAETSFKLAPDAKIMQGAKALSLGELKVGQHVTVHYTEDGTTHVAHEIKVAKARHAPMKPKTPSATQ
jgi:hypothetical protein